MNDEYLLSQNDACFGAAGMAGSDVAEVPSSGWEGYNPEVLAQLED